MLGRGRFWHFFRNNIFSSFFFFASATVDDMLLRCARSTGRSLHWDAINSRPDERLEGENPTRQKKNCDAFISQKILSPTDRASKIILINLSVVCSGAARRGHESRLSPEQVSHAIPGKRCENTMRIESERDNGVGQFAVGWKKFRCGV